MNKNNIRSRFSEILLRWYKKEKRKLPFRQTKEPYKVWLSEIILRTKHEYRKQPKLATSFLGHLFTLISVGEERGDRERGYKTCPFGLRG